MKKKTINRINGSIAIYFGISTIIGSIGFILGIGYWLYKVLTDQAAFSWGLLIGLSAVAIILAFIGYSVVKTGYDEFDN